MEVTIIIPNYNGKHFMGPCLEALQKQTMQDFRVLVVDNASSDGSVAFLKEHYPNIDVLSLDKNYGFSCAVNRGIKDSHTPYVLLLNNDTVPTPTFVEELVKAANSHPLAFSIGSQMIQLHHPDRIDSAGDEYNLLGWAFCNYTDYLVGTCEEPRAIFSACAGAALYRTSAFRKIGYFDEAHFAYLEDVDIGYRARLYGYQNYYCPKAKVYHVGSGTSGSKYNSFKVKLSSRNNLYVIEKNMPLFWKCLNFIPLCLGILTKQLLFIKKGFGKDYFLGLKEGLKTKHTLTKIPFSMKRIRFYMEVEHLLWINTWRYIIQYLGRKK